MKFLIVTEPDDRDSLMVQFALQARGHQVRLLYTADLPSRQRNSAYISANYYRWKLTDEQDCYIDNQYDVVWWRRPRKPYVPDAGIHPEDRKFVQRENVIFHECLTDNLAPDAWWINPKMAAKRANSKLYQLKVAAQCGLVIPSTLCSNDPEDICEFIVHHEKNGVIYKPLLTNSWFEEKAIKISYTAKIQLADILNPELLQWTPGIYQKQIKKSYELRIICFGNFLLAAKINSQLCLDGQIDWRAMPGSKIQVEPYQLPLELQSKIREFMKQMGLVFGSIDIIVDENGQYIFLEVNEQGQFLWVEEYSSDIHVLDLFVNFLEQKSRYFIWNPNKLQHRVQDYSEDIERLIAANVQSHVYLNSAEMQGALNAN